MITVTTEQVEPITQPAAVPDVPAEVRVDHVRTHGPRCFWDFRDCRWDCSRA